MEWRRVYLPTCPYCRKKSKEKGEEPPCKTCRVELLEENEEAGPIYEATKTQVIATGFAVIDINFLAVKGMMELYGVKNQKRCWEKVHWLWHEMKGREG